MAIEQGETGYFLPEARFNELQDIRALVRVFASSLDGPNRQIVINNHDLLAIVARMDAIIDAIESDARPVVIRG